MVRSSDFFGSGDAANVIFDVVEVFNSVLGAAIVMFDSGIVIGFPRYVGSPFTRRVVRTAISRW